VPLGFQKLRSRDEIVYPLSVLRIECLVDFLGVMLLQESSNGTVLGVSQLFADFHDGKNRVFCLS